MFLAILAVRKLATKQKKYNLKFLVLARSIPIFVCGGSSDWSEYSLMLAPTKSINILAEELTRYSHSCDSTLQFVVSVSGSNTDHALYF